MRFAIAAMIACLTLAGFAFAADAPANPNAAAAEMQALRKDLADMKAELEAAKKEMVELKKLARPAAVTTGWPAREGGPDVEKLQKITLPENPTEEQARKYIEEIIAATEGQRSFSSDDPQMTMLVKVGPDRLNLLIDALNQPGQGGRRGQAQWYLTTAMRKLVNENHKKLIIDSLAVHQNLVDIVIDKGWAQDAKDVLLKGLAAHPKSLPVRWVDAVAQLDDPKTYDDLIAYFIDGSNKEYTYKSIADLPGLDLADAVRQAWEKTNGRDANNWQTRHMAMIAVEYGHLDALELLVTWIAGNHPNDDYETRQVRAGLLRCLPIRGTNAELAAWYEKNKNALDFDPATKKFVVFGQNKAK